ncbi:hypothetical protein ALP44_102460 [Pseudomonas syringae pv. theae]|uniref:Uncharacterized protein n=1 Tax=Pseudomonas syringae pv. theae TaxID=103985 RepID=A0A3M5MBS1_PSESX|nr:hypothetical protein ALP44_102460 [Pseudomonas syringae pv. theae]
MRVVRRLRVFTIFRAQSWAASRSYDRKAKSRKTQVLIQPLDNAHSIKRW